MTHPTLPPPLLLCRRAAQASGDRPLLPPPRRQGDGRGPHQRTARGNASTYGSTALCWSRQRGRPAAERAPRLGDRAHRLQVRGAHSEITPRSHRDHAEITPSRARFLPISMNLRPFSYLRPIIRRYGAVTTLTSRRCWPTSTATGWRPSRSRPRHSSSRWRSGRACPSCSEIRSRDRYLVGRRAASRVERARHARVGAVRSRAAAGAYSTQKAFRPGGCMLERSHGYDSMDTRALNTARVRSAGSGAQADARLAANVQAGVGSWVGSGVLVVLVVQHTGLEDELPLITNRVRAAFADAACADGARGGRRSSGGSPSPWPAPRLARACARPPLHRCAVDAGGAHADRQSCGGPLPRGLARAQPRSKPGYAVDAGGVRAGRRSCGGSAPRQPHPALPLALACARPPLHRCAVDGDDARASRRSCGDRRGQRARRRRGACTAASQPPRRRARAAGRPCSQRTA